MKPNFEEPIVEIIELNDKDIVCGSGCYGAGTIITDEDPL